MSRRPTRRTVLRGLLQGAVVSVALPPLEAFFNTGGTAYACGGAIPRRFGLFFWGNGNLPDRWTPLSEGAGYGLSDQLAPLAGVQELVTVVTGLAVKVPNIVPHGSGAAGLLTGLPLVGDSDDDSTFAGPTVDQLIAAEIGGDTVYRSLQTAATDCTGMSYNGPNSRNPAETDPLAFFERIFGAGFREPGEEAEPDPTLGLRRSVLDAVMGDIDRLQGQVGASDRQRLEQHFDGIRELEQRLARLEEDPPNLAACARPAEPAASYPDESARPQLSARSRVMVDMLAMALACDQTRVFGHYLTDPVSDVLFPGASAGHHDLTHNEPGDQPEVHAITVQCVEEFAYLVQAFAAVDEGDGTLLDNSVVLGTSEVSLGRTHAIDEIPILLAGTACGALVPGIHHRSSGSANAGSVMLSLVRAMGILAPEWGADDGRVTDGLSAIEV